MKKVVYEDEHGRKYLVLMPKAESDDTASMYPAIGPPDVAEVLGLPKEFATRLHNKLFDMGLWSMKEVSKSPGALQGALQSVLKIDVQTLHRAYYDNEKSQT